jgi:hypothetical protein
LLHHTPGKLGEHGKLVRKVLVHRPDRHARFFGNCRRRDLVHGRIAKERSRCI